MANKFVNIKWQKGTIPDKGVNGAQVEDVIHVAKEQLLKLQEEHPCKENRMTITALDNAINYQDMRTNERKKRGVEGEYVK